MVVIAGVVVLVVVVEEVTLQESRAGVRPFKPPVRSRTAGVECGEWGVDKESERRHKEEEKKEKGRGTETVCLKLTG